MENKFDVIIIGGGAAGCAAALTCRNRGKDTAMVINPVSTTALYKAECVSNYPGCMETSGKAMAVTMLAQAHEAGAVLLEGRCTSVMPFGDSFGVAVGNDYYQCSSLILALGITREKLYPGEAEFLGRGVSYCATCDGMLYRGKTVALLGNSDEAERDLDFLRSIGCKVLHFPENRKYRIEGGVRAEALLCGDERYPVSCVFIIKDTVSVAALLPGLKMENGGLCVNRSMETAIPGVFAAGDCTGKPYQLGKAVGEGNVAALSACAYADERK